MRTVAIIAVLVLIPIITIAILFPGIPLQFLSRTQQPYLNEDTYRNMEEQAEASGPGYIYSLKGMKNYFSGEDSQVFYLGRKSEFEFEFFLRNIGGALKEYELLFFLNYKKVHVSVEESGWKRQGRIKETIGLNETKTHRVKLDSIPSGVNELCIVISSDQDISTPRIPGEETRFFPRDMQIVRIVKEYDLLDISYNAPSRTAPFTEEEEEIVCLVKDSKLAVLNPFKKEVTGVLFFNDFDREPLFYKIPKVSAAVFETAPLASETAVYNVTNSYDPMEDFWGNSLFPHDYTCGS